MKTVKGGKMLEKVQFWRNGIMIGVISRDEAIEKVKQGKARIITKTAIEEIGNKKPKRTRHRKCW